MKKTLITLMALAGVAVGETYTITPLTDSSKAYGTWSSDVYVDYNGNAYTTPRTGWAGTSSTYTFGAPIVLSHKEDSLVFSYDITNDNTGNYSLTLAFIGTDQNNADVVVGTGKSGYTTFAQGTSAAYSTLADGKTGFVFETSSLQGDHIQRLGTANNISGSLPKNAKTTLTGTIAWSDEVEKFQLTFSTSATSTVKVIDLGTSFTAESLVITSFANTDTATHTCGSLSNISMVVTSVPEPATATLSLLALAGLAARRRRK